MWLLTCGAQIWVELARPPSADQRELLDYVFQAWYALGRLGGFNSLNLQARRCLLALLLCIYFCCRLAFWQAKVPGCLGLL